MTPSEYLEQSGRTAKAMETKDLDMVHAALGIAGEAGEFIDAVKKVFIYNKLPDIQNAIEELGDLMWYIALACRSLGITLEEVMQKNINKLSIRYPDKYTDTHAAARLDKVVIEEKG